MKAQIDVILRPNLSSAYIMKRLAHGTAKFIASVYCSDLVMLKPLAAMMFGSQAPSPMATPKNAVKQIMPAMTRTREHREHDSERIALGVAGGVGRERLRRSGNAEPRRARRALPCRGRASPDSAAIPAARSATPRRSARRCRRAARRRARHARAIASEYAAEQQHERGSDRPHAGAADEMNDRQDAAANALGRIFAGIGEGERLLGAEADARR